MRAALQQHEGVVLELVRWGVDLTIPDREGTTPVMAASQNGTDEVLRELLRARASVSTHRETDGYTALMLAVTYGNNAAVRTLLRFQADVNSADKVLLQA